MITDKKRRLPRVSKAKLPSLAPGQHLSDAFTRVVGYIRDNELPPGAKVVHATLTSNMGVKKRLNGALPCYQLIMKLKTEDGEKKTFQANFKSYVRRIKQMEYRARREEAQGL